MSAVGAAGVPYALVTSSQREFAEAVLAAAIENDDYRPFEEFLAVLARPFEERAEFAAYAEPAPTGV